MYSSANRLCLSFSFVIFHHLLSGNKKAPIGARCYLNFFIKTILK
nr:MAG TPA: hypothetical protein [Caudoviricetes sp.]